MAGNLQPLVSNQRIVNADGTPTEYFIRWAQAKQIDLQGAVTAAEALEIAQTYVDDFLAAHPLSAGSGISLTPPDGNIGHNISVAAQVQEILDQISTTRGTVLFRGAADWEALAPGTAGKILQTNGAGADPTWVTPSGGGGSLTKISQVVLAAPAGIISFAAIPNTYTDLIISFNGQLNSPNVDFVRASLNADVGANYEWSRGVLQNSGPAYTVGTTTGLRLALVGGAIAGANYADSFEATIFNYARTAFYKQALSRNSLRFGAALNTITHESFVGVWKNTAAVASIDLRPDTGSFTTGTIATLYGRS
jgi:hypothetical protein